MKQQRVSFEQHMEQLARRHGVHSVFSDFLTLLVCAFSHGQREEEYLKTIRKYEKPEAYRFSEALAALTVEMTGDGSGMVDVLGAYFEEHISHGHNGQFFTPQHLCDMMARLMNPTTPLERILDPACGSGRMLMAIAKLTRHAL
ncbi:MAG TPA: N-6 DNA methylase, partial [Bacteroidales bacterium]|nr:N-6 DNA methylase [Bacteroidales bacterium]